MEKCIILKNGSNVVNFLIMALIVFCIVKAMNAAGERFGHKEEK